MNRGLDRQVDAAVELGCEALFARQRADGVFTPDGTGSTGGKRFSPGNTAAALIALHHAGEDLPRGAVERLCTAQRPDGGWAMGGVPTELLATAVVTAALRLVACERAESVIAAGEACVERLGGAEALPEPSMTGLIRQYDALSGAGDLAQLPRLPIELLLLRGPARRLLSLRVPIFASMALAQSVHRRPPLPLTPLSGAARRAALGVVRDVYEREGATGQFSTDPWLTSLISLGMSRSGLAPDISRASARSLQAMARADGGWDLMPLDITWSSFATAALLEAGYGDDARLEPTRAMFRERQQNEPFGPLGCPPGFWGFSSASSWPMALETAEVSSALLRLPGGVDDEHARRGLAWLDAMQDPAGSWSLAVRGSRPGGFGPCPQMTAKAVRTLLDAGAAAQDPRVVRALKWLARVQGADGSFEAQWYRGRVAGTAAVLETYCRAGQGDGPAARRARDWLLSRQRDDGSWSGADSGDGLDRGNSGDSRGSADDGEGAGAGAGGTVEDTAWALHALAAAGVDPRGEALARAARRLADSQRGDGSWPGGPVNEYIRFCMRYTDDGIASGLAVRALARHRRALRAGGAGAGAGTRAGAGAGAGDGAGAGTEIRADGTDRTTPRPSTEETPTP